MRHAKLSRVVEPNGFELTFDLFNVVCDKTAESVLDGSSSLHVVDIRAMVPDSRIGLLQEDWFLHGAEGGDRHRALVGLAKLYVEQLGKRP